MILIIYFAFAVISAVILFFAFAKKAYVIKSWKASDQPVDDSQNHIAISGRAEGLMGWLLAKVKISPTTSIAVSAKEIRFTQGSFAGSLTRVIPLENVCSTRYGYYKPWREVLILFVTIGPLFGIGIILAILYYFLNKSLTLGFVENSGVITYIAFKRSIIEGQNIDEANAAYVSELTQALIANSKSCP